MIFTMRVAIIALCLIGVTEGLISGLLGGLLPKPPTTTPKPPTQPSVGKCTKPFLDAFFALQQNVKSFLTLPWRSLINRVKAMTTSLRANYIILELTSRLLLPPNFQTYDKFTDFYDGLIPNVFQDVDKLLDSILSIFGPPTQGGGGGFLLGLFPGPKPEFLCNTNPLLAYVVIRKYSLDVFTNVANQQIKPGVPPNDTQTLGAISNALTAIKILKQQHDDFLIAFAFGTDLSFLTYVPPVKNPCPKKSTSVNALPSGGGGSNGSKSKIQKAGGPKGNNHNRLKRSANSPAVSKNVNKQLVSKNVNNQLVNKNVNNRNKK